MMGGCGTPTLTTSTETQPQSHPNRSRRGSHYLYLRAVIQTPLTTQVQPLQWSPTVLLSFISNQIMILLLPFAFLVKSNKVARTGLCKLTCTCFKLSFNLYPGWGNIWWFFNFFNSFFQEDVKSGLVKIHLIFYAYPKLNPSQHFLVCQVLYRPVSFPLFFTPTSYPPHIWTELQGPGLESQCLRNGTPLQQSDITAVFSTGYYMDLS